MNDQNPSRPRGITFWLLDGQVGWRTPDPPPADINAEPTGLRLAADPSGPLGLSVSDDSLGRLTLPRGMALAGDGTPYLLVAEQYCVKRFVRRSVSEHGAFVPLPAIGGRGSETRQFGTPTSIAIT